MIKKLFLCLFVYFISLFSVYAYNAYNQGDKVTYNGIEYYVIYDSDESSNVLTLLKAEPFTVAEVEKYGVGHINNYSIEHQGQVTDYNNSGYGNIVFYSSEQCGWINNTNIVNDCKYDYENSDIKYVVDAWAKDNLNEKDLWKDNLGYSYRLITKEEILEYMSYALDGEHNFSYKPIPGKTPSWFYNDKYYFWTMSNINKVNMYGQNISGVLNVGPDGRLVAGGVSFNGVNATYYSELTVRPVVLLRKKALESKPNSNTDSNASNNQSGKQNNNIIKKDSKGDSNAKTGSVEVRVPDTFTKVSILFVTIGIILIGTATTIIIYIKTRRKNEKNI